MYLLTPVDVVVNIEDIKIPDESQNGEFDFDMKQYESEIMIFLIRFVQNAVDIYSLILIVFALMSWFPNAMNHVLDA